MHISLDLETLSTRPDAAIASIGAVAFDIETGHVLHSFYTTVAIADDDGHLEADTIMWWMRQPEETRRELTGATCSRREALEALQRWLSDRGLRIDERGDGIWCKDPDFDLVILDNAFRAEGMALPHHYSAGRSVRTMEMLAADFGIRVPRHAGTMHNALDDAKSQAAQVSAIYHGLAKGRN